MSFIDAGISGFKHMPIALLSQAAPVQNTWYTVLDTTLNCRVIGIAMEIGTANEDLEIKVTIDGQVLSGAQANAVFTTIYFAILKQTDLAQSLDVSTTVPLVRSYLFEGRSVKVEIRKTSANNTGTLRGSVIYAVR